MGVAGRPVTSPLWFIARGGEGLSQGDYVKLAAEVAQVCSAKIAARVGEAAHVLKNARHLELAALASTCGRPWVRFNIAARQ